MLVHFDECIKKTIIYNNGELYELNSRVGFDHKHLVLHVHMLKFSINHRMIYSIDITQMFRDESIYLKVSICNLFSLP